MRGVRKYGSVKKRSVRAFVTSAREAKKKACVCEGAREHVRTHAQKEKISQERAANKKRGPQDGVE